MIESGNIFMFALLKSGKNGTNIKIINMQKDIVMSISDIFFKDFLKDKKVVKFEGEYKTEFDEILKIENFELSEEINEAINNPLNLESLEITAEEFLNIKAICMVEDLGDDNYKISCQKFKKTQYLLPSAIKLFFDKNTVSRIDKPGINITDQIDCYIMNGDLYFSSYYIANQIFELGKYYREATDSDVKIFLSNSIIKLEDENIAINSKWARRKIAAILDSGVLEKNTYVNIKELAKELKISLDFDEENKKIIFPKASQKQRYILKFLLDEIYVGPLTDSIYETNSKKSKNVLE